MAIGTPFVARADTPDRLKRIGILTPFADSDSDTQAHLAVLRSELARLGWTEGREIQIDYRWGAGEVGRIRSSAKELVELEPDVLLGRSNSGHKGPTERDSQDTNRIRCGF